MNQKGTKDDKASKEIWCEGLLGQVSIEKGKVNPTS